MKRRSLRTVRLAFVLSFFAVISLVEFTHIEKGPLSDFRCPACKLEQSVLGSIIAAVIFLPLLALLIFLEAVRNPDYKFHFIPLVSSRSPPSA